MENHKVKILVCCHKEAYVPNDDIYLPIHVGKAISKKDLGFQGDDEGDNISYKNPHYCELTALYWAWKNLRNVDYIGLCHYRRYFDFRTKPFVKKEAVVVSEEWFRMHSKSLLLNVDTFNFDVVLPMSIPFRMNILERHALNLNFMDMAVMEKVVLKLYPEYRKSLEYVFYHSSDVPQRNMFLMKKEYFDRYCEFLFNILFEVEKYVKLSPYAYYRWVFGFMREMLLPLFCYHNKLKTQRRYIVYIDNNGKNKSDMFYTVKYILSNISFKLNELSTKPIYSVWKKDLLESEFPDLFK